MICVTLTVIVSPSHFYNSETVNKHVSTHEFFEVKDLQKTCQQYMFYYLKFKMRIHFLATGLDKSERITD